MYSVKYFIYFCIFNASYLSSSSSSQIFRHKHKEFSVSKLHPVRNNQVPIDMAFYKAAHAANLYKTHFSRDSHVPGTTFSRRYPRNLAIKILHRNANPS